MLTPFQFLPRSVQILLIINAVIFGMCLIADMAHFPIYNLFLFNGEAVYQEFQIWRPLTYMFTHVNVYHFVFNMLGLWMFCPDVAEIMGEKKFCLYYLGTGIFAGLCCSFGHDWVLGASGALMGIFYAYVRYFPERIVLIFFFFPMKMRNALWLIIAMEVVLEVLLLSGKDDTVAHMAHIGGIIAGWLYFSIFERQNSFAGPSATQRWLAQMRPQPRGQVMSVDFATSNKNASNEDSIDPEQRLDEILVKVSKDGINSLSETEKDFLLEASRTRQIRSGRNKESPE